MEQSKEFPQVVRAFGAETRRFPCFYIPLFSNKPYRFTGYFY